MACGQGMQVMHCMINELLRKELFLEHEFGTKTEKSETDFFGWYAYTFNE